MRVVIFLKHGVTWMGEMWDWGKSWGGEYHVILFNFKVKVILSFNLLRHTHT